MGYRIVARQDSERGVDSEVYQVVDSEGREYCTNAGGGAEATRSFSLAVECYCELTGEDPDSIDGFHDLEIDGVAQEPFEPTEAIEEGAVTPQARVLELRSWEDVNDFSAVDLVKEYFNCVEAEIDETGDIWIEDPQAGHWIDGSKIEEFLGWVEQR